ncbi:hypothetical protein ASE01_00990 [Nocardioides sp. Root190]|uniref:hypothetical protein n=1 Tax=Nocardioides sp. Root190 TaxID=1736488 RepID=UPI0006FA0ECA|nr:hypothetical protein [Nocardioides sp. Root190]KRB80111.1 hypothetical protein ASE01_00990 [Nocardioides sp. Root190]
MDTTPTTIANAQLCQQLHALARAEDEAAALEAARVPYWAACPPSVHAHREAARSLRSTAYRLQAMDSGPLQGYPRQMAG